jgi:PKD repeat protein
VTEGGYKKSIFHILKQTVMKTIFQILSLCIAIVSMSSCGPETNPTTPVVEPEFKVEARVTPTSGTAPIKIDASALDVSGEGTSYEWDFGDKTPKSYEKTTSHLYTSAGSYTIILIAKGKDKSEKRVEVPMTVNAPIPKPIADFSVSKTVIEVGETVVFIDKSLNNPTSLSWSLLGSVSGTASGAGPIGTKYNSAGTYTVTLTAKNSGGESAKSVPIIVNPKKNKVSYDGMSSFPKLKSAIDNRANSDIKFVRFSNDERFIVAYDNGYSAQYFGETTMNNKINEVYKSGLSTACYVGASRWGIVWGGNGYQYNNFPTGLGDYMKKYNVEKRNFVRIDFDVNNNWVFWADGQIAYSNSYVLPMVEELKKMPDARGFAFGNSGSAISWVVYGKNRYSASPNLPSSLRDELSRITLSGKELIDVEVSDTAWVVIYK